MGWSSVPYGRDEPRENTRPETVSARGVGAQGIGSRFGGLELVTQAEFESATFGFGGRTSPRDFNYFGDLDGCRRLATALVGRFENNLRTAGD